MPRCVVCDDRGCEHCPAVTLGDLAQSVSLPNLIEEAGSDAAAPRPRPMHIVIGEVLDSGNAT